jgi:heterotetrameric sarcosine oxidase gamma subunit
MATEIGTGVALLPPNALIAVEIWFGAELGPVEGDRTIRVEPTVWWLSAPLSGAAALIRRLEDEVGERGAVTDISGAFSRLRLSGPRWRAALMIGGVFDAEDPRFGSGATAGTILNHAAVRYDVISEDAVEIYVPPSHVADLVHHLRGAADRADRLQD